MTERDLIALLDILDDRKRQWFDSFRNNPDVQAGVECYKEDVENAIKQYYTNEKMKEM